MPAPASATSVGGGGRSPNKGMSRPAGGGRHGTSAQAGGRRRRTAKRTTGAGSGGMWRFYTDDSPASKCDGPVPVLVMSLLFIASVFMLHIWGKYTRG
ncbi:protein transport protein Sec61 subunit beta-like [Pollicipes pollicipes]|uniref:protein transport protein Sec61 subunit beta-like n=1 Tax=Pollicipes pollicipes TaxID=41117 RepID=UPI0018859D32|nr:protein transport protein Sec61 subunit beta-like [Pollicipes pollicipes]